MSGPKNPFNESNDPNVLKAGNTEKVNKKRSYSISDKENDKSAKKPRKSSKRKRIASLDNDELEAELLESRRKVKIVEQEISHRGTTRFLNFGSARYNEDENDALDEESNFSFVYPSELEGKLVVIKKIPKNSKHPIEWLINTSGLSSKHLLTAFLTKETDNAYYLVSDRCYCTGVEYLDNKKEFKDEVNLPPWQIFKEIVETVEYLHEHGVVHRHLKPSNFLIQRERLDVGNGVIYTYWTLISDFGYCRWVDVSDTDTVIRQNGYTAPEALIRDNLLVQSSDMYSLGVIGYEIMARRHPFGFGDHMGNIDKFDKAERDERDRRMRLNEADEHKLDDVVMDAFVRRMMSPQISSRPTTNELLSGPMFKTLGERMEFIKNVYDHFKADLNWHVIDFFDGKLEDVVEEIGKKRDWWEQLSHPHQYFLTWVGTRRMKYGHENPGEFIRAIRNTVAHKDRCKNIHDGYFSVFPNNREYYDFSLITLGKVVNRIAPRILILLYDTVRADAAAKKKFNL